MLAALPSSSITSMEEDESEDDEQHSSFMEVPANPPCECNGRACATKTTSKRRGCTCRDRDIKCSKFCPCSKNNPNKLCKNKVVVPEPRRREPNSQNQNDLSKNAEDMQENNKVKELVSTLNTDQLQLLVLAKYQCGTGSVEFIQAVLGGRCNMDASDSAPVSADETETSNRPAWCQCGNCFEMQREIENKCCKHKDCIIDRRKFFKFCLDPENLEMAIKNTVDIRNDARDNSTRAFRKAAYRNYVFWRYGYLGKGNRRVCPSCVVMKIRSIYPSPTGIYMGFKES